MVTGSFGRTSTICKFCMYRLVLILKKRQAKCNDLFGPAVKVKLNSKVVISNLGLEELGLEPTTLQL